MLTCAFAASFVALAHREVRANPSGPVTIDRSNFGGRYDATVDPATHTVTMSVDLEVQSGGGFRSPTDFNAASAAFKPAFVNAVEQAWAGQYQYTAPCDSTPFRTVVKIAFNGSNPNGLLALHADVGGRSNTGGLPDDLSSNVMNLQTNDNDAQTHTGNFIKNPNKPAGPGNPVYSENFTQVPSAHEFGHFIGDPHPICAGNQDRCYGLGVSPTAAADMMGVGHFVSVADYAPFAKIMALYAQRAYPGQSRCDTWTPAHDPNGPPPPPPMSTPAPAASSPPSGRSYGDPQILTYDGYAYGLQAPGEFILTRATAGSFEVQTRAQAVPGWNSLALNSAAAIRAGSDTVAYYAQRTPDGDAHPLRVDGHVTDLAANRATRLPGGGVLQLFSSGDYALVAPSGETVALHPIHSGGAAFVNVAVTLPSGRRGGYVGILGDADGNPANDLTLRDGKRLPIQSAYGSIAKVVGQTNTLPVGDASFTAALNRTFADSWRIASAESLFAYAPGTSTATFTDRSFPRSDVTLAAEAIPGAAATCRASGVAPEMLAGCTEDVAATGDATYAQAAAATARRLVMNAVLDTLHFPALPSLPRPTLPAIPFPALPRL